MKRKCESPILLCRLVVWLMLISATACGQKAQVNESRQLRREFHLVADLRDAKSIGDQKAAPALGWTQLIFDRRLSIAQAVNSELMFRNVPSGPGRRLLLGLAAAVEPHENVSGRMVVHVTCRGQDGDEIDLLNEEVLRAFEQPDQTWVDYDISLSSCSGQTTDLVLRTECEGGSCDNDQVYWGDPHVRFEEPSRINKKRVVLLISIDTLRPDRMELYEGVAPTPNLVDLSRDSVVFDKTVAPSPWTIPSHASLFTSTYPSVHGTTAESDIPTNLKTIAETIKDSGWISAGFVDTPWLGRFGFDRGFDHFDATAPPRPVPRWGVGITKQRLSEWLTGESAEQVFIFWHIMDVHGPYGTGFPFAGRLRQNVHPAETEYPPLSVFKTFGYHDYLELDRFRCVEDVIAAYDEGISRVDEAIGDMLDFLKNAGLYEDSTIVVTSDHGESLFDHEVWIGHGLFLNEDEIRIPLVVKLQGNRFAGRRVHELVRLVDVAPTILDEIGVSVPETFQGRSLLPAIRGEKTEAAPLAFGTSSNTGAHFVRTEHLKYISRWSFPREYVVKRHLYPKGDAPFLANIESDEQLFDIQHDPMESKNLINNPAWHQVATQLRNISTASLTNGIFNGAAPTSQENSVLTEAEIERLRALGYLIDKPD